MLAFEIRDLLLDSMEGSIAGSSALRFNWVEDGTAEADGRFLSVVIDDFVVEETGEPALETEDLLGNSLEGTVDEASVLRF